MRDLIDLLQRRDSDCIVIVVAGRVPNGKSLSDQARSLDGFPAAVSPPLTVT